MIVKQIKIWICQPCLDGKDGECHVPECALCRHTSLGFPIIPEVYEVLQEFDFDEEGNMRS